MEKNLVTLDNGIISADILLPGNYNRSRYDHSGMVEQVRLGEKTFLSREKIGNGYGLGGVGLACCFEWKDTKLHDETAVADLFLQPGVGLLKRCDTSPWLFNRDYPVIEFEHIVTVGEQCSEVHTLPQLCNGVAIDQWRQWKLDGNSLVISACIRNTGSCDLNITEFCHNFFCFDGHTIDSSYRLSFPYSIIPRMRRGQILIERDALRPGAFDESTASSAYWINGYEGLHEHWMKLENSETGTGVLVEENFPLYRIYNWSNKDALCPETFIDISLKPGESAEWIRKYSFYYLNKK